MKAKVGFNKKGGSWVGEIVHCGTFEGSPIKGHSWEG